MIDAFENPVVLANCPHCNSGDVQVFKSRDHHYAVCLKCGATGGKHGVWLNAVAKWNARPDQIRGDPVAVRYDFDGYGWRYADTGNGSDWLKRAVDKGDAELLYGEPWNEPEKCKADGSAQEAVAHMMSDYRAALIEIRAALQRIKEGGREPYRALSQSCGDVQDKIDAVLNKEHRT